MLTSELINQITLLFDEEQKQTLEFDQGNRKMTIQKQVNYYFGNLYPFTFDTEKFLDGFALTIQKNIGLIYKIEKLKIYSSKLSDERGYRRTTGSLTRSVADTKSNTINTTNAVKEFLKHGKTRSGGTERGDDYEGIEELYTLEDKKDLETDVRLIFKGINQDTQGLVTTLKSGLIKLSDQENVDEQITQKLTEIKELPSWTTVTSAVDRTKSRDSSISEQEGVQSSKTESTTGSTTWQFVDSESIINTIQSDIYDLRNSFWNSFYCLFREFPPCQ